MDNCCAPQWADFTRSPCLPSDSYFETEHEVHQSRNRIGAERFGSSPRRFEESSFNLDTEIKVEGNSSNVQNNRSHLSFFIPIEKNERSEIEEPKSLQRKPDVYRATRNLHEPELGKKRLSTEINNVRRMTNTLRRRSSQGRIHGKVLTCQYVRRSLTKNRRRSNQYVSLAEAVSKFQSDTPQRFRTISQKNLKPMPPTRTKQKLTHPISPALRCKYRSRISTQQHSANVTADTSVAAKNILKKIAPGIDEHYQPRKITPIIEAPSEAKLTNEPKEPRKEPKLQKEQKAPKERKGEKGIGVSVGVAPEKEIVPEKKERAKWCIVPGSTTSEKDTASEKKVISKAFTVQIGPAMEKKENVGVVSAKTVPRLPPAFEARNREFQMKKEQRLKAHQETAKAKAEFHAKPVPSFIKKSAPAQLQQQQQQPQDQQSGPTKKGVVPCPFSFDQRDKCLAKKREERIKQLQEQGKKPHVFHANPVPTYKPAPVRSSSRENLRTKEHHEKLPLRQTRSCFGQENREPNILHGMVPTLSKKNEIKSEPRKEAQEIQPKVPKKPTVKSEMPPVMLNTDKRAKERCEFDEKIRKKKMQEELERQEEERNRLNREKQEQAELRKMAETRARPMPVFKAPLPIKSSKALTTPKSPAWASRPKSMKSAP